VSGGQRSFRRGNRRQTELRFRGHDRGVLGRIARGAYRREVLLVLTATLAIDYADRAALGALGPDLEHAFDLTNVEFGLLASAFSVVGGLATLPAGVLADRARRTLVLAGAVGLWTLAMGVTGAATSFAMLVAARIFLGAVTATGRPMMISIAGDVFPTAGRGRALGVIGSGAIVGDGFGFLLAGAIAALLSWRGVFWTLGLLGLPLVLVLLRLREPDRTELAAAAPSREDDAAVQLAEEADDVEPEESLVLDDVEHMPFHDAVAYVLRVRTQVLVIVATAIASFFFAGIRTFAVVFLVKSYGIGRSLADVALVVAGVGAVTGILAGGRIGDALIERGHLNGRLVVASYSYLVAAAVMLPVFVLHSLWLALPALILGAAALAAPIAPLDAVRIDVIHPRLWGRAEGIRSLLLIAAEAAAPLAFGVLSDHLAGGGGSGLAWTFVVTLPTLVVAAAILQVARCFYPAELAAAHAAGPDE